MSKVSIQPQTATHLDTDVREFALCRRGTDMWCKFEDLCVQVGCCVHTLDTAVPGTTASCSSLSSKLHRMAQWVSKNSSTCTCTPITCHARCACSVQHVKDW